MEQITVNLLATGATPVCHVSQFDDGRTVRINLKKGADIYTLSGTEEVKMRIRKPDNTERVVDITNTSSSYVDYVSTPEDCDIEGVNVCELVIDDLGSKNFLMNVEEDAYGGGADIETLTASGSIATFETNMVDNLVDLKAEITPIQDLHGYDNPWPAGGGKNILDANSYGFANQANIIWGGTAQGYADGSLVLEAGTYTFSVSVSVSGLYISDNQASITTVYNKTFVTFTITEQKPIKIMVYKAGVTSEDILSYKYQLERGSTATDWTPYENVCPITGHAEAKIVHKGKNLINDAIKYAYSGNIVYIGQTDNNYRIFLKAGTYTVSVDFNGVPYGFYFKSANSANEKIWGSGSGITSATFIIPEDGYYRFWVYYNPNTGTIDVNNLRSIQIELGSEVTDYEPFAGSEVTVQFGQTVFGGVLDAINSILTITKQFYTVTSSTSFSNFISSAQYGSFARITPIGMQKNDADISHSICSMAKSVSYNDRITDPTVDRIFSDELGYVNLRASANVSVSDITALRNRFIGADIVYELATPIEIPLSAISQFETLLGVNNVYSDIGDVELKYLKQV